MHGLTGNTISLPVSLLSESSEALVIDCIYFINNIFSYILICLARPVYVCLSRNDD